MSISFNTSLNTPSFIHNAGVLTQRSFTKIDGLPTETYLHRETPAEAIGRNIIGPAKDYVVQRLNKIYSIANRFIPSLPGAYAQEVAPCENPVQKGIDEELNMHESRFNPKEIRKNVFVSPSLIRSDFSTKIAEFIDQIESNRVGAELIRKINGSKKRVFINYSDRDMTHLVAEKESSGSAKITLHFSLSKLRALSTEGKDIAHPPYVRLFHDLVQAADYTSDKFAIVQNCDPLAWYSDEEYDTVIGLPSSKNKITENAFRKEEGLPERFGYISPTEKTPYPLVMKRIKSLAKIHQKNRETYPQLNQIAKRSVDELLTGDVLLYTKVTTAPIDASSPRAGAITTLYLPLDKEWGMASLLHGEAYRQLPVGLIEATIKELLVEKFPKKLAGRQFEILSSHLIQLDNEETRAARSLHESGN